METEEAADREEHGERAEVEDVKEETEKELPAGEAGMAASEVDDAGAYNARVFKFSFFYLLAGEGQQANTVDVVPSLFSFDCIVMAEQEVARSGLREQKSHLQDLL